MNSLTMETLLKVDDETPAKKSLKLATVDDTHARNNTVLSIKETPAETTLSMIPAVVKQPEPDVNMPETAGKDENSGSARVVKSYQIDRWCSAQVLWDDNTGQYRYELVEPQLSADEEKKYEGIVAELHKKPRSALAEMKRIGGRERIRLLFERLCKERGIEGDLKEKMSYCIDRDFWGYKKIHGLLADPYVEDISCNGYLMPVYVYLPGFESVSTNVRFASEEELDDFVMYMVQKGDKSISAANPIQDVAMPDGSRLNVTLYREVSSNGTTFSIRLANRAKGAAELLRHGTFTPEALAFLWLAMENKCSMAFIGGTASGKTAALNAVSSFIAEKNKVVTIEDTREVRLSSHNWTPLVVRESGEAPITEFDLLVAAFRQRPEYVIVGEVRTPEGARAAIHGINSGHTVIMTFHADSPASFFNRITEEPFRISPHIASGISLCISLSMVTVSAGGADVKVRRCRSIGEVTGVEEGNVVINPIFEWDAAGDVLMMTPENSVVIRKIRDERCWTDRRMIEEIADRTAVLRWMARQMICDEEQVRKAVGEFYRNRSATMEKIRSEDHAGGRRAYGIS
jgi:Type IV secretory pathway, VirB11 components, and related ATPases involved in archaeal flagella biosynthesis